MIVVFGLVVLGVVFTIGALVGMSIEDERASVRRRDARQMSRR